MRTPPEPDRGSIPNEKTRASAELALEHRFNDDLLISEADQALAKDRFPEIYHVLDHPELRAKFLQYDAVANREKWWVQLIGLFAVLLATAALLSSALTPLLRLLHVPAWVEQCSLYAEVCGVVGTAIAAGGIWIGGKKKTWLQTRMMAEVLRLWHFQSLIFRGSDITASCNTTDPGARAAFQAARTRGFNAFVHEWSGAADSHLEELVDSPEAGYQLFIEGRSSYAPDSPVLNAIFMAYKQMRLRHQAHYANYKLQKTTDKLWLLAWPSAVLQKRVEMMASVCLIGSLTISLLLVIGHMFGWSFTRDPGWAVGIIALLILNVATRAIQDGLAAPEELQRYNDYAGKIRYLLLQFEASHDAMEKVRLMEEMERAALQELKGFLRAYYEARFLV